MTEANNPNDATTQAGAADGDAGDLETAGETTAAEMIGGPPDTRPVGLGTIADIKISDSPETPDDDNDD
jgi:hypothetical protein